MLLDHDFKKYPELTNAQLSEGMFVSPHPQIKDDFDAICVKVKDGDTIELETDFRDFTFPLRFADIDAPEMNNGGYIARDFVKDLIEGKQVRIEINPDNRIGRYGRLIGRVLCNGLNIGEILLSLGYVVRFGHKLEYEAPPMTKIFRLNQWFT